MIYNCIFIQYKSKVKRVINLLLPTLLRHHQTRPVTLLAGKVEPRLVYRPIATQDKKLLISILNKGMIYLLCYNNQIIRPASCVPTFTPSTVRFCSTT